MPDTTTPLPNRGSNQADIALLEQLERKVLWLSSWTIHNANHVRESRDGLKVGGHQASSASVSTMLTALYFSELNPEDRVAVKPHASPAYHAIQYLMGRQSQEQLQRFRALGGAQSYPSRTKDRDDVDVSTGSVGLGAAFTSFAALVQDYVQMKWRPGEQPGRMISIVGDAELDEGNVFEALLEGWKHDIRNVWWLIDYNRQSLDAVVSDRLFGRIDGLFHAMGWDVITLKYGRKLQAAFAEPGGEALRDWIDDCPNSLYSALVYKGGAAWRAQVLRDIGAVPGIPDLLAKYDDPALADLMTNLAGQDMAAMVEAFRTVDWDRPTCFIAYTIKGNNLPFAGHKDNHAGIMNTAQMEAFRSQMHVAEGQEWEKFAGMEDDRPALESFIRAAPFLRDRGAARRHDAAKIELPAALPAPKAERMSTQEGFGRILSDIARVGGPLADRIVTTSPDVTVSTNLGGWVNARGIFAREPRIDVFREEQVVSAQRWSMDPKGQHIELGIAENNLFLMLAALGLSGPLFGERLLPVGTLYDPFIMRGLDAMNYALYMDARFMVVATPSGLTLAPEGGAHQSIETPLIGMGLPNLAYFEPAYVDELAAIMHWGFDHMQADDDGGSVYLRLSTRSLAQPDRPLDAAAVVQGGYWLRRPAGDCDLALVAMGAVLPEALEALDQLAEDAPGAGLLVVTSPSRLHRDWRRRGRDSWIARLLGDLDEGAALVSLCDGHPATLSWLGSVRQQPLKALGVEAFGQSGDIPDLYRTHGLDAEAILDAVAAVLTDRLR
ncbi:MAG: transketolase [Alphaproteobacteria bacterium]|nr:transketolase [Alphaproteobacteria bacterium]MCB9929410.1 transketolase [Alphaproteobacteria bacterium]